MLWDVLYLVVIRKIELKIPMSVYAKHNLKKMPLVLVYKLVVIKLLTQLELILFVNAKQVKKYKTMVIPLIVTNV